MKTARWRAVERTVG